MYSMLISLPPLSYPFYAHSRSPFLWIPITSLPLSKQFTLWWTYTFLSLCQVDSFFYVCVLSPQLDCIFSWGQNLFSSSRKHMFQILQSTFKYFHVVLINHWDITENPVVRHPHHDSQTALACRSGTKFFFSLGLDNISLSMFGESVRHL